MPEQLGDPRVAVIYFAIGGALVVHLLLAGLTTTASRGQVRSGWHRTTGSRSLTPAMASLAIVAFLFWPLVAAIWIGDALADRRGGRS